MNQQKLPIGIDISLLLGRIALGLYFIFAGIPKVAGEVNHEFGTFYHSVFKSLQPVWLPDTFAMPYGYAVPWLEVIIGGTLLLGILTRLSGALITLMLISYTMALAMKFGITAQAASDGGPFKANYVMIPLALAIMFAGGGRFSFDALFNCQCDKPACNPPEKQPDTTGEKQ